MTRLIYVVVDRIWFFWGHFAGDHPQFLAGGVLPNMVTFQRMEVEGARVPPARLSEVSLL